MEGFSRRQGYSYQGARPHGMLNTRQAMSLLTYSGRIREKIAAKVLHIGGRLSVFDQGGGS